MYGIAKHFGGKRFFFIISLCQPLPRGKIPSSGSNDIYNINARSLFIIFFLLYIHLQLNRYRFRDVPGLEIEVILCNSYFYNKKN